MATLTRGKTFVSGETVEPADMHQLVDQATIAFVSADDTDNSTLEASAGKLRVKDAGIVAAKLATGAVTGAAGGGKLAASAITDQTALDALANADSLLIHDDSTSALRKVTWSQIVAAAQPVGSVLQTVQAEVTSLETITNNIPWDDSIPQNTEGSEVVTATITPSSASNKVLVRAALRGASNSGTGGSIAALFIGSEANSLAAWASYPGGYENTIYIEYLHSPSSTSALTYKIRAGASSGTFYVNGSYLGGRLMGGVGRTTLTLQEIKG